MYKNELHSTCGHDDADVDGTLLLPHVLVSPFSLADDKRVPSSSPVFPSVSACPFFRRRFNRGTNRINSFISAVVSAGWQHCMCCRGLVFISPQPRTGHGLWRRHVDFHCLGKQALWPATISHCVCVCVCVCVCQRLSQIIQCSSAALYCSTNILGVWWTALSCYTVKQLTVSWTALSY